MTAAEANSLLALSAWTWVLRLGGLGLLLLGVVEASMVLPGSTDALTIVLSASHRSLWFYYAAMATLGATCGGYFAYRLGKKGGKSALEKKFPRDKMEKVYRKFEKGGFGTIFIACLLPPPMPTFPFVITAGALNYPTRKFLTALCTARALRYSVLAILAATYGQWIFGFARRYYRPLFWTLIGLAVTGALTGLVFYLRHRQHKKQEQMVRHDVAA